MSNRWTLILTLVCSVGLAAPIAAARAQEAAPIEIVLQNDVFSPADAKVPANVGFVLKLVNKEKAAVEFEAKDLKIEKVVVPGGEALLRVRPLKPGRYLLVNEYKEASVKTFLVAE